MAEQPVQRRLAAIFAADVVLFVANGQFKNAKHWSSKRQQKDLTPVLLRSVEAAPQLRTWMVHLVNGDY